MIVKKEEKKRTLSNNIWYHSFVTQKFLKLVMNKSKNSFIIQEKC